MCQDAKRKADAATIARKKAEMKTFMLQGAVSPETTDLSEFQDP